MARENYQSYNQETGSEPNWIMRSSGPQKQVVGEDLSPRSYIIATGGRRLQRNRRHLGKVHTPTRYDTSGDDSQIPDISSEPTLKVVLVEDSNRVPESSDTSPDTSCQNAIPEKGTSSGRLIMKPIPYREDI